jgi:hypothetical protein
MGHYTKQTIFCVIQKFANPEIIMLGKKNMLMQAYGQNMMTI